MKKKIWNESLYMNCGQRFIIEEIIYKSSTKYFNDLIIFNNKTFGKIMALDGIVQTTENDEFVYHEMMVHVPMFSHLNPKKILVIGGGDGGILREIFLHSNVESVTMVEIDEDIINTCKKYLPNHNKLSFENPKLKLVIEDGLNFVIENREKYDIIICDCTDPIGPGKNLFSKNFYSYCSQRLDKNGIFIAQNGVFFLQKKEIIKSYHNLKSIFNNVSFYYIAVPTYYGGLMTVSWATQNKNIKEINTKFLENKINMSKIKFRYYNISMHQGCFSLPQNFLLDQN